jgi:hypothetical protein
MIIGTVKADEAEVFDSQKGYHQFHTEETQQPYGSFEVFFQGKYKGSAFFPDLKDIQLNVGTNGWYWWSCFPGYLPEGDPVGPFATSQQAHQDADEWDPKYND